MSIVEALNIDINRKQMISIVGAGGKTTTMFLLGQELKKMGKKVLLTTTTKIMEPDENQPHDLLIVKETINENFNEPIVVVAASSYFKKGKLDGFSKEYLDDLYNKGIFDFIIIEADGANRMPIKAPKDGEPVIPCSTDLVIGIVGLDSLGSPVDKGYVHRWELFKDIVGCEQGDLVTPYHIAKIMTDKKGIFKNTPEGCTSIIILNKAVSKDLILSGEMIKEEILKINGDIEVIIR